MSSAWSLHPLTLLQDYPQISISVATLSSFFFYYYYFFHTTCSTGIAPVNWPLLGMLPGILANFHRLHNYICDIHREVGTTFMFKGPWFFSMNFLFTCDPANVQHIFTANFHDYPKGEDFNEILDGLGGGLFSADAESWRIQRKMSHTIIGDRGFRSFAWAATLEKVEHGLLPLLDQIAASDMQVVNIDNVFSRVTFDVTCNMVFGVDPGSLSIAFPTVPFSAAMDDFWDAIAFRHALPKSWWKVLRHLGVGPEKKMAEANKQINQFIAQQISRKREKRENDNKGETPDLLSYYMDQPFEDVEPFFKSQNKFLRDTVLFLIIAGRDGFALSLSWFFWLLSKNPNVEAKILDELRAHALRRGTANRRVFDVDELSSMVYLHGAVCEGLRLYAPVPVEHKRAMKADVLPSGHRVEPGMKILVSVYSMGRMEKIWGKDCLEFKPERWISEKGKIKHVPAYKFMVFNTGPRACLGKEIGLIQLKAVVAALIWNFEVKVVEGQVKVPKNSTMLMMKNGLNAKILKRVV